MTARERKTIIYGALVISLMAAYQFWPRGENTPAADNETIALTEQRLEHLRNIAASASAKQDVLKKVQGELAQREKGLIRAESAQQAQAQTLSILQDLLSAEAVEYASTQLGQLLPLGDDYGLVEAGVQMECHMEQLLNIMANLSGRQELLVVRGLQISSANAERKTVRVNLRVAGVVARSLLPAKDTKGGTRF